MRVWVYFPGLLGFCSGSTWRQYTRHGEQSESSSGLPSNMAPNHSTKKTIVMIHRRSCTKFTEEQLQILTKAFNQKLTQDTLVNKSLIQKSKLKSPESIFGFRSEELVTESRKRAESEGLKASQDQDHPEEKAQSRENRWYTLPLDYTSLSLGIQE